MLRLRLLELQASDFLKSTKNLVKNAMWTRTDFRVLLCPSRARDGKEVMIAPPYRIKQCRLQTPGGVLAQWKLRIVLGRLMTGDEAYSPDSSDGILDSEKEELMPTYHVEVDGAIQRKPKGCDP